MENLNIYKKSILSNLALAGFVLLLTIIFVAYGLTFSFDRYEFASDAIFFRSWESKTIELKSVYNTIRYFKKAESEIWMMNQSHHGLQPDPDQLDRLAIVVKKVGSEKRAQFYQLKPGPLEWSENLISQKIDLKINCQFCHSNGPRAIRPAPDFESNFDLNQKAQIFLLNLRIKFYGKIKDDLQIVESDHRIAPNFENLKVVTCLKCHDNGNYFWSRSGLTSQQKQSVKFMLENSQMPPSGFVLSASEIEKLNEFIKSN